MRSRSVRYRWMVTWGAGVALAALGCGGDVITDQQGPQVPASVTVTAPEDTLNAIGATAQLSATVTDANGNAVSGATVAWSSSDPALATVDAGGLVTAVDNGDFTITATADGVMGSKALVVAQAVSTVTVTPATASIAPGATQQFSAAAADANGNPVTGVNFFWASSNHIVSTVDQNGLAIGLAGGQATITAVGKGEPGNGVLRVSAVAARQIAFSTQPANATAGEPASPALEVEIRDAAGNVVTSARDAITLSIGTNPGGGTLSGTSTVNAVSGIATFSGLSIDKAGTGYTLVAASGTLASATSVAFDVTAGAAARLAFDVEPTDALAGGAIGPPVAVAIHDAFGNTVTSTTDAVTVALETNPGGGTLSGTLTVTAASGVATFSDLSIDIVGTGYTLAATSGALTGATSAAFGITPAAAAQLAFVIQPADAEANVAITPGIQVAIQDAFGNTVTSATDPVTVAIGTNPSGGVLSGTVGVAAVGGIATFDDLVIDATGDGYTLDATSGILTGAASASFDLFLDFTQVTTGDLHSCGVTTNGNAWCWGFNGEGELGDGATTLQSAPVMVLGGHQWASLEAGSRYTCGVRTDGAALCWGKATEGRLGNGTTTPNVTTPDLVLGGHMFSSLSAGNDFTNAHTCGVRATDNAVLCWGSANNGKLGNGATTGNVTTPALVLGGHTFSSVSAGARHTCGIRDTDNAALCWGFAGNGQLGNGLFTPDESQPVVVLGGNVFVSVSAGDFHSCGVRADDFARCWGASANGRLGNGSTLSFRSSPQTVLGGIRFFSVIAGNAHSCGVAAGSNAAFCWGQALFGALGNATTTPDQSVPVAVFGSLQFFSLSTGSFHSCGATASGAYCWGAGTNGQLGEGLLVNSSTPVRVRGTR